MFGLLDRKYSSYASACESVCGVFVEERGCIKRTESMEV